MMSSMISLAHVSDLQFARINANADRAVEAG